MTAALDGLLRLLDLETIEVNIFRGRAPKEDRQRTYGGLVAGQALVAAARTVEGHHVHSLHSYFLRPGASGVPILYEVDRVRDGRSFSTRRVTAIQNGKTIFTLAASFHVEEPGFEHSAEKPDAPSPESLPDFKTRWAEYQEDLGEWYTRPRAIDMRYCDWNPSDRQDELPPRQRVWMRSDGALPDEQIIHTVLMTWASDMTLLDTSLLPHGVYHRDTTVMMASLDHAMWFHRPFRMDDWLLYVQDSPSATGARGFARGLIFNADGDVVASCAQEGLIRQIDQTT